MKKASLMIISSCLIILIYSCGSNIEGKDQKNKLTMNDSSVVTGAPDKELKFIAIIDSSSYKSSISNNEFDKKQKVNALYLEFRSYVKTILNDRFDKWTAKVTKIENGDDEHRGVILSFNIYNNEQTDKSVQFNCFVPINENKLTTEIRELSIGDKVIISGKFEYSNELLLKMQSTKDDNSFSEIFTSPEFFILLTQIKKS
ncbi:hypothetical protein HDF26_001623 [Pedobacter cryoconitis]|uniref:hypothetical protein n=1 Tax=Pedobacter cryoconitis TaxID=188932 RepID=UPI00160EEFB0|nr:hypothetical protein [Pedobacter cryoconitis]MBB6271196.1 hypothetical protein [Pedobacter cryoconitis]